MRNLLKPYDPAWKTMFEKLHQVLGDALYDFYVDIQHVGSTSIPGLCAKPVLDIDIILYDIRRFNALEKILKSLGYISRGNQGIPGRFAFRQSSTGTPAATGATAWQEHHLYVCYADSLALKNHLTFRDALLQDKDLARRYADYKMKLANGIGMTRERYSKMKTDFVLAVLASKGFTASELEEIRKANL